MIQKAPGVASAALGRILSETRVARGLTLEDVERDTRIAKRYLQALEHEEFSVLPAPVYCRAFLRTYAQYLGLDSKEIMRLYPDQAREPDIAPLPQVSPPTPPALSLNWIIAGGVVFFLLVAGILLYRAGGSDEPTVPAGEEAAGQQVGREGAGAEAPDASEIEGIANPEGETAGPPVEMPDLRGKGLAEALVAVNEKGLDCVIMQVYSDKVPQEVVISQSPLPGSEASAGSTVTLTVSRGSS